MRCWRRNAAPTPSSCRTTAGAISTASRRPIEVLPEIVDAAGKRLTVIMDSGVRRGSDVVKALALGAKAVMIGRPTLYGTALGGEAGAARAIGIFRDEIDRVMAHLGCCGIAEIDRDCIAGHGHGCTIRASSARSMAALGRRPTGRWSPVFKVQAADERDRVVSPSDRHSADAGSRSRKSVRRRMMKCTRSSASSKS